MGMEELEVVVEKNTEDGNEKGPRRHRSHWDANARGGSRDLRRADVSIRDRDEEKTFEGNKQDKICSSETSTIADIAERFEKDLFKAVEKLMAFLLSRIS